MATKLPLRPHLLTRSIHPARRSFSTTTALPASPLFMLSQLSNSRETTHFNQITKLPRYEHSPSLAIIKDSEVKPYPLPSPPPRAPRPLATALDERQVRRALRAVDVKTIAVGRAVLAEQARLQRGLRSQLVGLKKRAGMSGMRFERALGMLAEDRDKARKESQQAAGLVVIAVGVATAAVTWRLWPQREVGDGLAKVRNASEGGRMARDGGLTVGAPAIEQPVVATTPARAVEAAAMGEPAVVSVPAAASVAAPAVEQSKSSASWWKGLFWKQS
ncbi:hypothetical protein MBLNU230_g5542t1 [Neophaeotheca triangularis]